MHKDTDIVGYQGVEIDIGNLELGLVQELVQGQKHYFRAEPGLEGFWVHFLDFSQEQELELLDASKSVAAKLVHDPNSAFGGQNLVLSPLVGP